MLSVTEHHDAGTRRLRNPNRWVVRGILTLLAFVTVALVLVGAQLLRSIDNGRGHRAHPALLDQHDGPPRAFTYVDDSAVRDALGQLRAEEVGGPPAHRLLALTQELRDRHELHVLAASAAEWDVLRPGDVIELHTTIALPRHLAAAHTPPTGWLVARIGGWATTARAVFVLHPAALRWDGGTRAAVTILGQVLARRAGGRLRDAALLRRWRRALRWPGARLRRELARYRGVRAPAASIRTLAIWVTPGTA